MKREMRREVARVNHHIKSPEVRLIDQDGAMVGIVDTSEALARARVAGLDLVEVAAGATPPVCKIVSYGRFKFEKAQKEKEEKRNQRQGSSVVKTVQLRPKTDLNDIKTRCRQAASWMKDGARVKVVISMKGRENTHPEVAGMRAEDFLREIGDVTVISPPRLENRAIVMIVGPKP